MDRHYIEGFLARRAGDDNQAGDVRGHVLEFGGDAYARRFGARDGDGDAVERIDVLDVKPFNQAATIVGDVEDPETLPAETFDCILCIEVLELVYDVRAAVANLHRALRPNGVLLVTVNGICQIGRAEIDHLGDYWRFTSLAVRRLLEERFPPESVHVEGHGNVRAATAFLYGLAAEELLAAELDLHDRDYEVIIAARAVKSSGAR